jgi:4-hydroxy-3-methylbut-2-enyl diphosphate reductase
MEIILTKEMGFCNGVKMALKTLDKLIENKSEKIYSIGEIIHNPDVIKEYERKGVKVLKNIEELNEGIGVVRAHGLPLSIIEDARKKGKNIIDATCPFVRNISKIIEKEIKENSKIFLIGEKDHPEVVASTYDYKKYVEVIDYENFSSNNFKPKCKKCAVLAQTTLEESKFIKITTCFIEKCSEVHIYNTICPAAKNRQKYAEEVAKKVDLMIILGGKKSSNTKRLFEVCKKFTKAIHIERINEINPNLLKGVKKAGITAGTSTPEWIIEEAINFLEKY